MVDKYTATWLSYSSISDWLECPRAYFLKHVYRQPETRHKVKLMSPSLALGSAVHETLEALSREPKEKRFNESLMSRFDAAWMKISGRRGGFLDRDTEFRYETRGREMINRVQNNPGPLSRLAVKIQSDLPYFWLSEEDNIILCGKIDWLEYLSESDSVRIIDFKTGRGEEDEDSLQLPIYHLLVHHCQNRRVESVSYWYLDRDAEPVEQPLPDLEKAREQVLKLGKEMKLARQLERFHCPKEEVGCSGCRPYEAILNGEAELVGTDDYNSDVYILPVQASEMKRDSVVL